jgi:hypothetical protein
MRNMSWNDRRYFSPRTPIWKGLRTCDLVEGGGVLSPFCPTWMRLNLSILSCTLPGTHRNGARDEDKRGITTHCAACRVTMGQRVGHENTDRIHAHIRTFNLFALSVDIVARWRSVVRNLPDGLGRMYRRPSLIYDPGSTLDRKGGRGLAGASVDRDGRTARFGIPVASTLRRPARMTETCSSFVFSFPGRAERVGSSGMMVILPIGFGTSCGTILHFDFIISRFY